MNWPNTKFTELAQITLPIIQAPMAGDAARPELVAAVSNAGGLGSLGAGYMHVDALRHAIKKIRQLTDKPFNINLFIPEKHQANHEQMEDARKAVQEACYELDFSIVPVSPPYTPSFSEQMNVILEEKIPIFSFTFGIPSLSWIRDLKKNGTLLIGTATSIEEALILEKNGIDVIVAQGSEAGGHRGTFIGTAEEALTNILSLVSTMVQAVNTPVIAAGGIMDAQKIYVMMKSGACAVQMGTAFLTTNESNIHPLYKQLLLSAKQDNTVLTRAFSGKLARGIANKFIMRMQAHEDTILDYPIQNALTSPMRREAAQQNLSDFLSLWAGQGVQFCKVLSVDQLIQELNNGVLALMNDEVMR